MAETQIIEELPSLRSWADELVTPKVPEGFTIEDMPSRLEYLTENPKVLDEKEVNATLQSISLANEKCPQEAYTMLEELLKKFPNNPKAHQLGVKIATKLNNLETAYDHALAAINEDPRFSTFLSFIGAALATKRESEALWGVSIFEHNFPDKLLQLRKFLNSRMPDKNLVAPPSSNVQDTNLGIPSFKYSCDEHREILQELYQLETVSEEFVNEKIIYASSHDHNFLLGAALLLGRKKRFDLAVKVADLGIELGLTSEKNPSALYTVAANSYYRLEKYEDGLALVNKGKKIGFSYDLAVAGLKLSISLDNKEAVEEFANRVLELAPHDQLAARTLGSIAFSNGDFVEARQIYSAFFKNYATANLPIFVQMIALELMAKDFEKAKLAVELMSKKIPKAGYFVMFAQIFVGILHQQEKDEQVQIQPSEFLLQYNQIEKNKTNLSYSLILARFSGIIPEDVINDLADKIIERRPHKTQSEEEWLSSYTQRALGIRTSTFFANSHRLRPMNQLAKRVVSRRKDSD